MINPQEAPAGYIALKKVNKCLGCVFHLIEDDTCELYDANLCVGKLRKDGCDVIFKRVKRTI